MSKKLNSFRRRQYGRPPPTTAGLLVFFRTILHYFCCAAVEFFNINKPASLIVENAQKRKVFLKP